LTARTVLLLAALVLLSCAQRDFDPVEVAPGVFAFIGEPEEMTPANRGNVVNTGFIVGDEGVIVIDSGANDRHGRKIIDTIERVTKKPIALLVNTHPHPENVLGNSAFARRKIALLAHSETIAAMRARCEMCFKQTLAQLNEEIMSGTEIVIPERAIDASQDVVIGGRRLRLLHFGWAHTEGDLAVLDLDTGVLFAGGLVFLDRIPVMQQASTRGWIAALEQLKAQPIKRVVPGVGPIAEPARIGDTAAYLAALLESIERQYAEGKSAIDVLYSSELTEFSRWALYDSTHPLNIQHVYRELEREELAR
jgi:quinoprotein relay system zinc metallohydrolase 1